MAIYHLSVSVVRRCGPANGPSERAARRASWKRGGVEKDRSAVGSAAYRAGVCLTDEHDGRVHDYRRKLGVYGAEILLPAAAPMWMGERSRLWNAVELAEARFDARVAREMNIALPIELSAEQRVELVRSFVRAEITRLGVVADVAYHDFGPGSVNPHVHVMMTLRTISADGFGLRQREMDSWGVGPLTLVARWRQAWTSHVNAALLAAGVDARIDDRSLVEQGAQRIASVHIGPRWTALNVARPATPMASRDMRSQANAAIADINVIRGQQLERRILDSPHPAAAARATTAHWQRMLEAWDRRHDLVTMRRRIMTPIPTARSLLEQSPKYRRRSDVRDMVMRSAAVALQRAKAVGIKYGERSQEAFDASALAAAAADRARRVDKLWKEWGAREWARWRQGVDGWDRQRGDDIAALAERDAIAVQLERWKLMVKNDLPAYRLSA